VGHDPSRPPPALASCSALPSSQVRRPVWRRSRVLVLLADLPHELIHHQFTRPAQEKPRRQTG
jgi:hypothetical protein